jgi:histidinol phosphatase-like PHP family hydrolase/predicted MPP superfamily phosphohydrolase
LTVLSSAVNFTNFAKRKRGAPNRNKRVSHLKDQSMPDPLDILVVSDLHYRNQAIHGTGLAERQGEYGLIFLRKSLHRLHHLGIHPDLIILLGDLVDDGNAPGAEKDLAELADTLKAMGLPFLAIHGNHDGDPSRFASLFTSPGLHEFGGYGFLVFNDDVGPGDVTTRAAAQLKWVAEVAAEHPDLPLIALQHNPLHPRIESDSYPYMMTNGAEILEGYAQARVMLSLSGHYHPGQAPTRLGSLTTYTGPSLCESPFTFAHLRLTGREVSLKEHQLKLNLPGVTDSHCHSEYAYCGTRISARQCLQLSALLGVETIGLAEHAFQLYFDSKDAWSFHWQTDPDQVQSAWQKRTGRMDEYRRFSAGLRSSNVKLGLEVDLCADGNLLLAPADATGWDFLVGAIHAIPGFVKGQTSQAEAEALFLRDTQRLLACGIQVLAHPFRFFARSGLAHPTHLYPVVAELLQTYGVAGEVNFHIYQPDPVFVKECVARGVKIALGSDGHDLIETGELCPHLRVLEQAGIHRADWPQVLFGID